MLSITHYGRRFTSLTTAAALLALGACSDANPVDAPVLPGNPAIPAQYRGAAFIMDVSALKKTVKISAPTSGIAGASSLNMNVGDGPQLSLLGGDVVDLTATNFVAGAVGASVPGKILITFDLVVNNKLAGIQLITPTFPTPPSGVTGVQAFPFEIGVTATSGGVGTIGNEIIVTSPRFGAVIPSNDWDGTPHNFFNDVGCLATSNDCFRYESFSTVAPLGASTSQPVGFLIDPTVGDFRVKLILAADLSATTTPTPGTISGLVSSPQLGNLNNVTVSVSGGFSGTTAATGLYSIATVATGSRTVSVSNLPAGCVAPASQNVTVTSGGAHTVNFTVTCSVPTGTIGGTISSSLGGGISGVSVVATPTGGVATPAAISNGTGVYSLTNVPAISATGNLTLTNLPANCTNPGPQAYSGFTTAGSTVNITVTCTAAPITYPLTGTWAITTGGTTGRQATLTLLIDMGAAPGRPDIAGAAADPLAGISFNLGYNGVNLGFVSSAGAPSQFNLVTVNENNPGTATAVASAAITSTSGATRTGQFQLIQLTFSIATGFTGTITPSLVVTEALATTSLTDVTSTVTVSVPNLIVP